MTAEEKLNAQREKSRIRQQRFKERVIAEGGIDAYRAKIAEYRRRYRAKKKAAADIDPPDTIETPDTIDCVQTSKRFVHLSSR